MSRKKREFLAAYYELNRLYDRLAAIRRAKSKGNEGRVLKAIQAALRARDALEDRYAPEGFIGEPEMNGLMTTNVVFSHALQHRNDASVPSLSSFSLFVPLKLPKGVSLRKYLGDRLGLPASLASSRKQTAPKRPLRRQK
ncbi:MAG: hypothetical protein ACR2OZ_03040 [Verrucomicrobiales bacterium]